MVEVNGQEEQGKLILGYNQNKSRKTESLDPKDEGDGGDTCIAVKREQGSLLLGSQKTNRSHLGSEVDWENTGKDFHTRQDSFCTLSPITYLYTLSLLPLSLFLPQSCLCTHAHTHTHIHVHTSAAKGFLHAPGCWSLLFIQTSLENKVKMSRSRTKLTVLMSLSPSSWGQERVFHFFFIPLTAPITRYHMLCTYLALNKCLLNGWLFPSPPPFPSHPYSIILKICCRAVGRGLRSVLTNNPYGCLKPKDRIFKAEIWAVTSWVFFEEMHKAVQIDSLSDRT